MRIVVLDGFTLNPGDLSWGALQALGECVVYDRSPPEKVVQRVGGAQVVLTNKTPIDRGHLEGFRDVQYIGVLATGFNVVDVAAARMRNISVTNVPAYGTRSVAQMTFALLLELTQHAGHHARTVRDGRWTKSLDFCYWDSPLVGLDELTLGIVGLGRIGSTVAELGAAFGMKVLATGRTETSPVPGGGRYVSLEMLFRESDVVSLHCPLTEQTKHLINEERLGWMKPAAFLLNTSRGLLVDEPALAEALNCGRLAGAGLDVLSVEPPPADNPLLQARNCLITPHIAWATRSARSRLMETAVENVKAFLRGQPQNVIN